MSLLRPECSRCGGKGFCSGTLRTAQQRLASVSQTPCAASSARHASGRSASAPKLPALRRIHRLQRAKPAPQPSPRPPPPRSQQTLSATGAPPDVDCELWELLELCSIEELEELHNILFGSSPLSPVVKSLVVEAEPAAAHLRGRDGLMRRIESRYRFLAADAAATLKGRRPSYRESLLLVRERLQVQCPSTLPTQDLETEIFLHMLQLYSDTAQAVSKEAADKIANAYAVGTDADGMAPPSRQQFGGVGWTQAVERVAAPLKLGGAELVPLLMKFSSALGVSSVRSAVMRSMGTTLLRSHLQYEAAVAAACRGAAASSLAQQAALKASQRGLTSAAARYGAARGMLSVLGPVIWAFFAGELALKSIGTDYGRIVRAIHTLAEVRMVRTHGWSSPQS